MSKKIYKKFLYISFVSIVVPLFSTPLHLQAPPAPSRTQSPEQLILYQKVLRVSSITTAIIFCLSTVGFIATLEPRYGIALLLSIYPWYLSYSGQAMITDKLEEYEHCTKPLTN